MLEDLISMLGIPVVMLFIVIFFWVSKLVDNGSVVTGFKTKTLDPSPGIDWTKLRANNPYWAARFTYQETGSIADLDKMRDAMTLDYPTFDDIALAPDNIPPAPPASAPQVFEQYTTEEIRDMTVAEYSAARSNLLAGGGGGGSVNTVTFAGDQRGSAGLNKCTECHDVIPYRDQYQLQVTCDCCHEQDAALRAAVGRSKSRSIVSRHDKLAQEQRAIEAQLDMYRQLVAVNRTSPTWEHMTKVLAEAVDDRQQTG